MKRKPAVKIDGKFYEDFWVHPHGSYCLAARIGMNGTERLHADEFAELQRYETDGKGNIIGSRPDQLMSLEEYRAKVLEAMRRRNSKTMTAQKKLPLKP
jgi:hypothetical protein